MKGRMWRFWTVIYGAETLFHAQNLTKQTHSVGNITGLTWTSRTLCREARIHTTQHVITAYACSPSILIIFLFLFNLLMQRGIKIQIPCLIIMLLLLRTTGSYLHVFHS
ncbi:hypothetical protein DFH11DRAFT_310947 [Phellopilus nigrolimitatus]|nr:hypothetical protein DFH11DRAFT_310947 [Phellopilus nigrolimitatus]